LGLYSLCLKKGTTPIEEKLIKHQSLEFILMLGLNKKSTSEPSRITMLETKKGKLNSFPFLL
jgi:hypothetical protein